MHGQKNIKLFDAKQVYHYKNIKLKLYKNNAAIWFNNTCKELSLKLCTDRPPGTLRVTVPYAACIQLYPPEDEHLRFETCRGEQYFMNK